MTRAILYAVPGLVIVAFVAGLDMRLPLFDHWHQLAWYARFDVDDWRVLDFFEPHGVMHLTALPRAILMPLAHWTGWRLEVEAFLDIALASVTLFVALKIAERGNEALGLPQRRLAVACNALMAVLVFSPVLWWAWTWTITFVHFTMNAAVVVTAWALTPVQGPAGRGRVAVAFVACLAASFTRYEGLLTWWIFLPCLLHALSAEDRRTHNRTLGLWLLVGMSLTIFHYWAVDALAPERVATESLKIEPWNNLVYALDLVGAPLFGFLRAALPAVPESSRYAPGGALIVVAYAGLFFFFRGRQAFDASLAGRTLPWLTLGFFALAFSGLIGLARVAALKSGVLTELYVSSYATTSTLVSISVLQLSRIAWELRGAASQRVAWTAIAVLSLCLAANYAVVAPRALMQRELSQGSGVCFEIALHLATPNNCFGEEVPHERLADLSDLAYRPSARTGLSFAPAPDLPRGSITAAAPARIDEWAHVRGRLAPGGTPPTSVLLARAGSRRLTVYGTVKEDEWEAFVPAYVVPGEGADFVAIAYERDTGRFIPLAGSVRIDRYEDDSLVSAVRPAGVFSPERRAR